MFLYPVSSLPHTGLNDVVAALVAHGAVVNIPASVVYNGGLDANQPLTPLTAAVVTANMDIAALLLAAGAPPTLSALQSLVDCPRPGSSSGSSGNGGTGPSAPTSSSATREEWVKLYGAMASQPPRELANSLGHQVSRDAARLQ